MTNRAHIEHTGRLPQQEVALQLAAPVLLLSLGVSLLCAYSNRPQSSQREYSVTEGQAA